MQKTKSDWGRHLIMGVRKYMDSIHRGLRRPEVRRHPIRAISRRIRWRWHWKWSPRTPIVLDDWWRNLRIALPRTSNAALLYYRTHSDESLLWLLQALLWPRMTFLDVGAHIGAFTLVGAKMVGNEGRVVAMEPMPPCAAAIRRNAAMNAMTNVEVYDGALGSSSGKIGFISDSQRSGGWIAASADRVTFEAQCWTLDEFLDHAGLTRVDVMKLDTCGNELPVLRGGAQALRCGRVRTLVMKLYNPDVTRERFGYDSHESLQVLRELGFQMKLVSQHDAFPISRPEDIDCHFDRLVYGHLLMAHKC
jgi:FkbM family methyltransferase